MGSGLPGLALGYLGMRTLLAASPAGIPRIGAGGSSVALDWRIFLFTLIVSVFTGILFGLAPALNASRPDAGSLARDSASQSGMGFRRGRGRALLVISEMALALVLLAGAGLLIRTFVATRTVSRGFDQQDVLTLRMSLSSPQFETTAHVAQLVRSANRRIKSIPGMSAVATTCALPSARARARVWRTSRGRSWRTFGTRDSGLNR